MSARKDILEIKHDLLRLKATRTTNEILADKLFENFIAYASANWSYGKAEAVMTTASILSSTGHLTVDCGKLRETFKVIAREDLELEVANAIQNNFITKPNLKCFDSLAVGNIRNKGEVDFNNGCFFVEHYFVNSYGKYYDPCMTSIYQSEDYPVYARTKKIFLPNGMASFHIASKGFATVVLRHLPGVTTHGFYACYEIFPLGELKNSLTPNEYIAAKKNPQLIAAGLK